MGQDRKARADEDESAVAEQISDNRYQITEKTKDKENRKKNKNRDRLRLLSFVLVFTDN